jgi:myo-inositol-1(or 4)-monophosphatase
MSADLELALAAARAAADVHRAGRGGALDISTKSSRADLVTRVDVEAERAIRRTIAEVAPTDAVLGEEGGESGAGRRRWIVDPLDGTLNYACGFPWYAVSIALEVDGVLQVGVVQDTAEGHIYCAERGGGALRDGEPLAVSRTRAIPDAMLATGFAYLPERMAENLAIFNAILPTVRGIRRPGAASLDLAQLAAGRLDGFWELYLAPWDVAAAIVLVEEAGGRVSGADGRYRLGERRIVASNGVLHDALVARITSLDPGRAE